MRWNVDERSVRLAMYICDTGATVRAAAKRFGISKSTVHKDVTTRLREVDKNLYEKTAGILKKNKDERHLRGGAATKAKYKNGE
ncbi:MAG: sporulation transcriptional regulator SpoIIID [Clostridia bacterium]|nr:sporulation transcriptional regulator SpoIIID [Clostridia bacterium]